MTSPDYVMVPREPTSEMHEAAFANSLASAEGDEMNGHFVGLNAKIYRAMLSAAPPSPRSDDGSGLTPSEHGSSAAMRAQVIEECAKVADNYARDGRIYKEYACESADEIAARIRSLSAVSAIAQERDVE